MNAAAKTGAPSKVGLGIYDPADRPAIDVDDAGATDDFLARRGRSQMLDVDLSAERGLAGFQVHCNRFAGRALQGLPVGLLAEPLELCRRHLNPGGVVSMWLPLYSLDSDSFVRIVKAFQLDTD